MTRQLHEMSLEELAVAAQGGRRECFDALTERLRPRLHRFLTMKTSHFEDAEDLVQEAFLRAFEKLDRYDARWRFSTWIFTIATHLAVSRHRAARPRAELGDLPAQEDDPGTAFSDRQEGERLWRTAREVLDDREYRALYLRYAEDLAAKEIAGRLRISSVHARVLLYRARRRLTMETST